MGGSSFLAVGLLRSPNVSLQWEKWDSESQLTQMPSGATVAVGWKCSNVKMSSGTSPDFCPPPHVQSRVGVGGVYLVLHLPVHTRDPSVALWPRSSVSSWGQLLTMQTWKPTAYPQPLRAGLRGSDNREGHAVFLHLSPFPGKRGIRSLILLWILIELLFIFSTLHGREKYPLLP